MSAPVDTTPLGLAESLPRLIAERHPRRWTVGIILTGQVGAVVLLVLGVLLDAAGWRAAVGPVMMTAVAGMGAAAAAEWRDERLIARDAVTHARDGD